MYTFGSCRKQVNFADDRPGPGAYDQGLKGSTYQASPQWKIGSEPKGKMLKSFVPGPGTYSYDQPDGIKYSFGRKTQIKDKEIKPGPGAYESGFKEWAPSYSMAAKTKNSESTMHNPGPGTYNYKSTVENVPSSKIGSEKRSDWPKNYTPGPGAYHNDALGQSAGPKYGFGSQMQRPSTANPADGPQSQRSTVMGPGPGTYNQSSIFGSNKKGPAMSGRHTDFSQKQMLSNPGPGAYDPEKALGKSSIRIGTQERGVMRISGTPGPGTYNSNFATKPRTPNYGMGTEERMRPMSAQSKGPGPGNYAYQSKISEGPKWGFGAKNEDRAGMQSRRGGKAQPGPGQYLPSYSQVTDKQPTFKFGTSSRGTQLKKQQPGPGQYDVRKGMGGPKYGFGSEMRKSKLNQTAPGPGSYNIPGTVGAVPKYLLPHGPRHV